MGDQSSFKDKEYTSVGIDSKLIWLDLDDVRVNVGDGNFKKCLSVYKLFTALECSSPLERYRPLDLLRLKPERRYHAKYFTIYEKGSRKNHILFIYWVFH